MTDSLSARLEPSAVGTPFRLRPLLMGREGYSYWLEIDNRAILLDFGCSWEALEARLPRPPELAILSHAHDNVAGGLAGVVKAFPNCQLFATATTLKSIALRGVNKIVDGPNCLACDFHQPVALGDRLFLTFEPAGHLPGAAVTILTVTGDRAAISPPDHASPDVSSSVSELTPAGSIEEPSPNRLPATPSIEDLTAGRTCIVAGDCALTASRLQLSLPLNRLREWHPEVLAVSGALGPQHCVSRKAAESDFFQLVRESVAAERMLLVPLPAMGLAQEILFSIATNNRLRQSPSKIAIWLDAAIASGCQHYQELLPHLPKSVRNYARDRPLFEQNGKYLEIAPLPIDRDEHRAALQSPGIVMCNAAASTDELAALWDGLVPERTTYVRLPEVELTVPVEDWPLPLSSEMQVWKGAWHSLSDRNGLKQIVHTLKPQHLIFTNGRTEPLQQLAQLPEFRDRYLTYAPQAGDEIALNLAAIEAADRVHSAAKAEVAYEGEVDETLNTHTRTIEGVQVKLPPEVMDDDRWDSLSETGLVMARWENDCLVIRGLSSRSLQREASTFGVAKQEERGSGDCAGCAFYAKVRSAPNAKPQCTQPSSPLYGVAVSPQGSCLDFKPADV